MRSGNHFTVTHHHRADRYFPHRCRLLGLRQSLVHKMFHFGQWRKNINGRMLLQLFQQLGFFRRPQVLRFNTTN